MNKKLIAIAILAGASFVSVAHAADGTLNFTGSITDDACTIDPTSVADPVNLGEVSSGGFAAAGDVSAATRFGITLTSCPAAAATASVKFDGPADAANSALLALTSTGGEASGVAVGIYEADSSTQIPLGSDSASKTLSTSADTTFEFIAKYVATAATVVAGDANAVSDFTVTYN